MYRYRLDGSNLVQGILSSGSLAIDTHFFLWLEWEHLFCYASYDYYIKSIRVGAQHLLHYKIAIVLLFSGVCLAHMFFNRMKNIDVEAICSCFETLLHIVSMIAYKVFSMLFPYIATLLLLQMFMKYFHDFSTINIPSTDHQTCETSMWRNILYIDQFYPLEERVSFLQKCSFITRRFSINTNRFAGMCFFFQFFSWA